MSLGRSKDNDHEIRNGIALKSLPNASTQDDFQAEQNLWEAICQVGRMQRSRLDERSARCGPTEAQKLEQFGAILDYESRLSEWAATQARELKRLGAEGDYQKLCATGCTAQVLTLIISLVQFAPFVEEIWTRADGGTSRREKLTRALEHAATVLEEFRDTSDCAQTKKLRQQIDELSLRFGLIPPSRLASQLRMYSRAVNFVGELSGRLETRSFRELSKYFLTGYVRRATGKFQDKHVSGILAAVAGPPGYNEVAQRMWRNRNYLRIDKHLSKLMQFIHAMGVAMARSA